MIAKATYLDWNATAPALPAAREAAMRALSAGGNPSAVHAQGRAARRHIEEARETLAEALEAKPAQIIFTSGASEANALAINGLHNVAGHILVSAIEHASVLETVKASGLPFDLVPVTQDGVADLAALAARLDALKGKVRGKALIAVMAANNETGVIQPMTQIVALARNAGALVHCDAVQMLGKAPMSFRALDVDSMALSGHKIGGPAGAGALLVRDDLVLEAQLRGGGQERRRRAGTENIAGIAGFAAAADEIPLMLAQAGRIAALRNALEEAIGRVVPGAVFFGRNAPRLGNTSCFARPSVKSDVQLVALDLAGIAVSAGAACSSGKVERSHVLDAMAAGPMAQNAIRVSLGWSSDDADIARFIDVYGQIGARRTPGRFAPSQIAVGV